MRHDASQLDGKISLVTGATGGLGRVVATELARRGSRVVIVVRDRRAGDALRDDIAARVGNDRVEVLTADLSARDAVNAVADRFLASHSVLNLLVNNAGAHFARRSVNADGVEMHVAVNHLAGFVLTERLRGALLAGAPARVVNVVSASMNDTRQVKLGRRPRPVALDAAQLTDLRSVNPADGYQPFTAYARSKLLALMAGYRLAEQFDGTGVTVNAVHPGVAATGVVDDMTPAVMKPFAALIKRSLLTPEQGAEAILRVATDQRLDGVTGHYFDRDTEATTAPASYDAELQQRVLDISAG
jgi:NAD(P)-dependent dehydrogenase (short-subunit alcohol dehydrogenase family)